MIELTSTQKLAVAHDGHLCLNSCPGSGKTRTIIAKILSCFEEVRQTPRRIACITYTNAGVDEIEKRLRQYLGSGDDELCDVCTIHSFCLNNILRPHAQLIPHLGNRWSVVTTDDPWYKQTASRLVAEYNIPAWAADSFEGIQRSHPTGYVLPRGIPLAAAEEFSRLADDAQVVPLSDIVYFASKIVSEHRYVARGLASRFAWIIIDEFQDTSVAQVQILEAIHAHQRTKMFIVGDPNQSIFGFGGARPDLMESFATHISARTDIRLNGNFRSSSKIIDVAECLCVSTPPMQAVGPHRSLHHRPEYVHAENALQGVFEVFLPAVDALGISLGETAILAPQWPTLLHLGRALRKQDVPIIGPGARPYRRSHEFALLAETLCAYILRRNGETASALQRAMFITLLNMTGIAHSKVYSYDGRRVIFRIVGKAIELKETYEAAADWLRTTALTAESILIEEECLTVGDASRLVNSANAMLADMTRNGIDVANLTTNELGLFASPQDCLHLMTMHKSKGREFDAVAVIDLHDGKVPHFTSDGVQSEIDEARRLLYVAATRARKYLMFITDSGHWRNEPCRFLGSSWLAMLELNYGCK